MVRIVPTAVLLALAALARGDLTYQAVAPSIERAAATTRCAPDALPTAVWIYRPAARIPAHALPCVFVAPAGSNGLTGMELSAGDQPEHLPYVKQGFVVVAYAVSGALSERADDAAFVAASKAFVRADGGLANLRAAIELATRDEPAIDPARLYTAGHSSAGTIALRAGAEFGGRIRGVVAYAPVTDLLTRVGAPTLDALESIVPGITALTRDHQPLAEAAKLRCPTMLFHASDDANVPIADTRRFADRLRAAGHAPLVVESPAGGHYDAMLLRGLDAGAAWLADRAKRDLGGMQKSE